MAEEKVLYNGRFVKNPLTSKTEHDGESYEVTVIGCNTNDDDEASIVYNKYLKYVIQKLAMSCGFIEITDSSTDG